MLKVILIPIALFPVCSHAACPKSIAGEYVLYAVDYTSSGGRTALGTLASLGLIPKNSASGAYYFRSGSYSELDPIGNLQGNISPDVAFPVGRYSYDGKCFGFFFRTNGLNSNTLDVDFIFVSDGGAQITVAYGPTGVAKNSAGIPIINSPWNTGGVPGIYFLRKQ